MRRVVSLFVACMLVGLASSAEPPQATPQQKPDGRATTQCKVIDDWILENRGNLPSTFDAIARFPLPYRKRIFLELSPDQQAGLWQAHLNRWLAGAWGPEHGVLSEAQRELVARIRDQVTAETYAQRDTSWFPLDEVREIFPEAALRRAVLMNLGPPEKAGEPVFQSSSVPNCHCIVDWIFGEECPFGSVCKPHNEGANCNEVRCGFIDLWWCDGMCCLVDPSGQVLC